METKDEIGRILDEHGLKEWLGIGRRSMLVDALSALVPEKPKPVPPPTRPPVSPRKRVRRTSVDD